VKPTISHSFDMKSIHIITQLAYVTSVYKYISSISYWVIHTFYEQMSHIMGHDVRNDILKFIYCSMISYINIFLMLVPCNHQESLKILSLQIWLYFAWIKINMWIYINISYFKISHQSYQLVVSIERKQFIT
jgi:hypothetical protein